MHQITTGNMISEKYIRIDIVNCNFFGFFSFFYYIQIMWLYYLIVLFVTWAQIEGRTIPRKALTVGINVEVSQIKKHICP